MIKRREFLKWSAVASSGLLLSSCRMSPDRSVRARPNIIFILADDLGYGDLGCYGQQQIKTPCIDKMAAEGMRFTQHYAGSTICAPSRCSLMTGLHTGHAAIKNNAGTPLGPDDKTVLEIVKECGYTTGVIGKWGLGDDGTTGMPLEKGADYFYGYLCQVHAWNYYPEWLWENDQKVYLDNVVQPSSEIIPDAPGGYAVKRVQYSHDLLTEEALNFVRSNHHHPFFLYLAYTIPHANSASVVFGKHGMEVPDYGIYKNRDWPIAQKGLAAMISRMDSDVGQILKWLKQLGIDEQTIVLFSSDNGPHHAGYNDPEFFNSSGPFRGAKRDLYEGGIRVPLIVRWPGNIKAGSTSDHISAFWDFLPTVCDAVGKDIPAQIDGISFLPELLGKAQRSHDFLYWEFDERGGHTAVRKGKWKYIKSPDSQVELYDLETDPGESNNVSASNRSRVAAIEEMVLHVQKK